MTSTQYLQDIADNIAKFQAAGYVVALAVRNNCPDFANSATGGTTVKGKPGDQNTMLDYTNGYPATQLLTQWFGVPNGTATSTYGAINYGGIMLGVYNEPTVGNGGGLGGGVSGTNLCWAIILGSTVNLGSGLRSYAQYQLTECADVTFGSNNNTLTTNWNVMDCQTFINTVRAAGGKNVIYINAPGYTNPGGFGGWAFINSNPSYLPTDPLVAQGFPSQLCMNWHVYEGQDGQPGSGQGGGIWADFCNLPIAKIVLECGDGSGGTSFSTAVTQWGDTNGIGTVWWAWNPAMTGPLLISSSASTGNGSPTTGCGETVYTWMSGHT